jgi:hypothetical protein
MKYDVIPIGGLNTDDDPRHFQQGDYITARNLHTGTTQAAGDEGLVSSVKSHALLTIPDLGGATSNWVHLGVAVDDENDRAYLLVYGEVSAVGQFAIVKHNFLDDTLKIIYQGLAATWNISAWGAAKQKCYNPRVVDGRLIWTDNVNDIRQMDMEKMETTTDAGIDKAAVLWILENAVGGYAVGDFVYYLDRVYEVILATTGVGTAPPNAPTYYTDIAAVVEVYLDPIDPDNFTLAALPPLISPTVEYRPDPSVLVNQLRGKTWQFSYQYVYMDYRRSTYAPPSIVPAPSQEEKTDGSPNVDPSHNNTIRLQINTGNEQVRSIRIVARTSEDPSTWFLIDEIFVVNDKDQRIYNANQLLYVSFLNDKSGAVVDTTEVINLFQYVPIRAKHMELIEGNRLAFGNITEGYSVIGAFVDIDLAWEDLAGITVQKVALTVYERFQTQPSGIFPWLLEFRIPTVDPGPCTFKIDLRFDPADPFTTTQYIYNGITAYPTSVINGLTAAFNINYPGELATCFAAGAYWFCAFPRTAAWPDRPYSNWEYDFYYEKNVTEVDKYPQLKTGATHAWAMIYRDRVGRITPLIGAEEMTKYIPFPTEDTNSNVGRRPLVTFNINHLPPPQAESYEIVYAGNKSTSWHLQLLAYNFAQGEKDHDDPATTNPSLEYFRCRIKRAQALTRDSLLNWSVEEYVWQKGDRIRIIGKVDAAGNLTEINGSIYDVEIMAIFNDVEYENNIGDGSTAVETTDEWIYFPINPDLPGFTPTSGSQPNLYPDNLWIEIYRPFRTESNLYFTTGMTYPIKVDVYGNKLHGGDTDQVLNSSGQPITPAIVANTSHDAWKYLRNFRNVTDSLNIFLFAESEYASDFYLTSKLTSQGSPIPDIPSQQQNVLTKRLRHGGKISIGSQLNLIAEFEFDDYVDLKDEHGPIEGMRLVGFVLKVVQYTKVVSVYISRLESFTASGEAEYLFTDKVFGSVRPSMENYGTQHPDSVIVHNRHLYFWDQSEGAVIRDAANGIVPISENKMNRYFRDLADTLKAYSPQYNVWVHFGFSKATNELFCLFGIGAAVHEIISFSEDDQRWKNQFEVAYQRGLIYWIGKRLFQTIFSGVYEWWAGTDFNRLTGNTRTPVLVAVANQEPDKVKTWKAVHVYQTGAVPQFNYVKIPAKATSVEGEMETNIYAANIEKREGVYYCGMLKDINTPGPQTQQWKELNGRDMRGLYCEVSMVLQDPSNPNDKVTLSNFSVVVTPSERSK